MVQQEDTFLCENVQVGLESAGYDTGRYVWESRSTCESICVCVGRGGGGRPNHTHPVLTSIHVYQFRPFITRYAPGVEFPDHDFHRCVSKELRAALTRLERAVGGSGII